MHGIERFAREVLSWFGLLAEGVGPMDAEEAHARWVHPANPERNRPHLTLIEGHGGRVRPPDRRGATSPGPSFRPGTTPVPRCRADRSRDPGTHRVA